MTTKNYVSLPQSRQEGAARHDFVGRGEFCRVCGMTARFPAHKWAGEATWDALKDQFDEVIALYECSGCHRWFHPGDTFVTGEGTEYCYDDQSGNGCVIKFLEPDKLAELGIREMQS